MKNNHKRAFALLYASMIGGLVLAIGAAILDVAIKEINLSSAGSQSQFAFYNADTGTECAMYLDRYSKTIDSNCPSGLFPSPSLNFNNSGCSTASENPPTNYTCLGSHLIDSSGNIITDFSNVGGVDGGNDLVTGIYSFSVQVPNENNVCFDIKIDKSVTGKTTITSRGYNTCDVNNINRFERAIEISF